MAKMRIVLEGSDQILGQLKALGQAGEAAFVQIQNAAKQPIGDPVQIQRTTQAVNGLTAASNNLGTSLVSAATKFAIAAGGLVAAISAATSAMTKGAVDTAQQISDQADAVGLTTAQWLELSKAIATTGTSSADAAEGMKKLGQVIKDSANAFGNFREVTVGGQTFRVFNGYINDTTTAAGKAAAGLRKLGVSASSIASGDNLSILERVAAAIDRIPNAAQRADAGLALFGKNWQDIVKALTNVQAQSEKAFRALSAPDVDKAVKLKDAWDDLAAAVRAVADRVGSLFLDPALSRATWLTNLVDGVHKLLLEFMKLGDAQREVFTGKLGSGPAETAFKILIALGAQLAGIWSALVAVGSQLMDIVSGIFESIQGITGSQVVAFFITAAAAALGLAIAIKAIALAFTPISLLLSLFTGFGPIMLAAGIAVIAFWDQIKTGAQEALALLPQEIAQVGVAIQALFRGDYKGFWENFSAAAISAFEKIKTAIIEDQGVIGQLARGIGQVFQDLPGAIASIVQLFILLGTAATTVANIINAVFGTQLTGTTVALIAIIGVMTGGLAAMAAVAGIVAGAFGAMAAAIGVLTPIIGGVAAVITVVGGALLALGAAIIAIRWDSISSAGVAAWNAIIGAISAATTAVTNFVSALGSIVWDAISSAGVAAWNAITNAIQGTISAIQSAISAIAAFLGLKSQASSDGGGDSGFAAGGLMGGRGTGTSDSNLAWLSRGEYITPARAVRQPGVLAFLEALRRSGGNLRAVLDDMGHFARGGLVLPAFAAGGLNTGGTSSRVLHLTIDGRSFTGLSIPENTAQSLERFAVHSQIASTGRRPSWRR